MKLTKYTKYTSILGKTKGLMFSRKKTVMFAFDYEQVVPLHTFFVFFPITVLFLDNKKRIVEQTVMKPFSFYSPLNKAKYVVELPFETKRKIGEKVIFE